MGPFTRKGGNCMLRINSDRGDELGIRQARAASLVVRRMTLVVRRMTLVVRRSRMHRSRRASGSIGGYQDVKGNLHGTYAAEISTAQFLTY
jgi:hypothetical protein